MKVQPQTDFLTPTSTDVGRVDGTATSPAETPRSAQSTDAGDQVSWSSDVQLAQAAHRAAEASPAVRADKVAEAKALLAQGQVGTDLGSLADSLIDALTK